MQGHFQKWQDSVCKKKEIGEEEEEQRWMRDDPEEVKNTGEKPPLALTKDSLH